MILGYSAAQMRAAEAPLLAAGVPLMQRAAAGLAREVRGVLDRDVAQRGADVEHGTLDARDRGTPHVLALVGTGNNGADTLYACATLAADGLDVTIVRTGERVDAAALEAALAAGAREAAPDAVRRLAASTDLVIDGILGTGTGANSALRGLGRDFVMQILDAAPGVTVVAVDIPSSIGPDDGSVPDPCVLRATVTVTFGGYKAGLLRAPASDYAGEVRLIDIGLAAELAKIEPVLKI